MSRRTVSFLTYLAAPLPHQRPRNPLHLRAVTYLAMMAPQLVEAFMGDDDGLVGPVTTRAESWCELIRASYDFPPVPVDVPASEARRLLEVSDLCWRVLSVSRKLKSLLPVRKREAKAITAERERWARALHGACVELRDLTKEKP